MLQRAAQQTHHHLLWLPFVVVVVVVAPDDKRELPSCPRITRATISLGARALTPKSRANVGANIRFRGNLNLIENILRQLVAAGWLSASLALRETLDRSAGCCLPKRAAGVCAWAAALLMQVDLEIWRAGHAQVHYATFLHHPWKLQAR